MHIDFTPEQTALRKEIRDYYRELFTPELRAAFDAEHEEMGGPVFREIVGRMGRDGWLGIGWPKEYGGQGRTAIEQFIFWDETYRANAPLNIIPVNTIGPTLMRHGSEEQKAEMLPKILLGELFFGVGYTEPEAGTDLASLQTRAVRDGDDYVINGQKVWTSYGDVSDWIFALVRTDPGAKKQEGITFLLIDMETPGVSVQPIRLISGSSAFGETHFENVRVPVRNAVNGIHNGWTVAKALLGHERTMIADAFGAGASSVRRSKNPLVDLARDYLDFRDGAIADAVLRDDIARIEMDTRGFMLTVQRARDAAKAGHQPGPESSMFKIYATELNQARSDLMVRLTGPQALGWEGPGFDDGELAHTRDWLRSRGNSIEGGTSEIQLNIIAKRVLALPD